MARRSSILWLFVVGAMFSHLARLAVAQEGILPIPEFARWEKNMVKWGKKHFDKRHGGVVESYVWYYDGQRVFYQIADYTGDKQWIRAAHNSRSVYRNYVLKKKGKVPGWRVFPHGLRMDWERHKDKTSREAVVLLATSSAFARKGGRADQRSSRETAYCINAYLEAERVGEPLDPKIKQSVEMALGHLDQWFVKNSADNWAPFMFALTCEALIDYYHTVKQDPRIPAKIRQGVDECWKRAWIEKEQAFWYRSKKKQRAPDLNLLVAPVYAWVYLQTGDTKYRDQGDKLFAGGVRRAWLGTGKCFSQCYRWSFKFIEWRTEAEKKRLGIADSQKEAR